MSRWKEQREAEKSAAKEEQAKQESQSLEEIEESFKEALNTDALLQSFMDKRFKEDKRMNDVINSDFYFCVCFNNVRQLIEFCERFGLNPDEIYMDGRQVARQLGRALREPDVPLPKTQGLNKDYAALALDK